MLLATKLVEVAIIDDGILVSHTSCEFSVIVFTKTALYGQDEIDELGSVVEY